MWCAFDKFPDKSVFTITDQRISEIAEDRFNWPYGVLRDHAAKLRDDPKGASFLFLAHAAYGWMPTMLKTWNLGRLPNAGSTVFQDLRRISNAVQAATYLEQVKEPPINNSWVGTSKVFHFINVEVFPIWDSRVAQHFGLNNATLNVAWKYSAYLQWLHQSVAEQAASIAALQKRFQDACGYSPSAIRCLELMLFQRGASLSPAASSAR